MHTHQWAVGAIQSIRGVETQKENAYIIRWAIGARQSIGGDREASKYEVGGKIDVYSPWQQSMTMDVDTITTTTINNLMEEE